MGYKILGYKGMYQSKNLLGVDVGWGLPSRGAAACRLGTSNPTV